MDQKPIHGKVSQKMPLASWEFIDKSDDFVNTEYTLQAMVTL